MIVIVAPYTPIGFSAIPNLGAARKIEIVIGSLSKVSNDIVLVNTAHNDQSPGSSISQIDIGGVLVKQITPNVYSNRFVGKFINLFEVKRAIHDALSLGEARALWVYNGYAFESLFAFGFKKFVNCPVILEFEDWHFSRSRGLNPKPFVDYILWRRAIKSFDFSFAVNDSLKAVLEKYSLPCELFQGLVSDAMDIESGVEPFSRQGIEVGYFGGLSAEKGVNVIVEAVEKNKLQGARVTVTGSGKLEGKISELAKRYPERIRYLGCLPEAELYQVIMSMDVIVNPHSSIHNMNDGVFPFKVIEAIYSGRLLISTYVPETNIQGLLSGVMFFDGGCEAFSNAVNNAKVFYAENQQLVKTGAKVARDNFSSESFIAKVSNLINHSK